MKKATIYRIALILLCLCGFNTAHAFDLLFEGKAAWMHPTGKEFHEIYGNGGIYGGEITAIFPKGFALWGSVDYFSEEGESKNSYKGRKGNKTEIQLIPVAFGLKYFYPIYFKDFDFALYGGAGAQWNFINIKNDDDFIRKKEVNKHAFGGIFKIGAIVKLPKNFFADLFVNYSSSSIDFDNSFKSNMSYFSLGIGLGYSLNFDEIFNPCGLFWDY